MMPRCVLGAVVVSVFVVVMVRNDTRVLSDALGLTMYSNGSAMVQVPYHRDAAEGAVSIAIDFNGDEIFEADEQVVDRAPARPQRYWNSNYFFRHEGLTADNIRVRVVFFGAQGREEIERKVAPTTSDDVLSVTDFQDVSKPELSMRQGTPDLVEQSGECAPTAAANALIALSKEHGQDGKLPSDISRMLEELKGDMRWTPSDGVVPDDLVAGSNLWSTKKGLPITTTKVGTQAGKGTLDALTEALYVGSAALMRVSFSVPDRSARRVVGGHLITVVGIRTINNRTYLEIHDPRRPTGTDVHLVEENRIIGYPFFAEGETALSWGFVQTWMK